MQVLITPYNSIPTPNQPINDIDKKQENYFPTKNRYFWFKQSQAKDIETTIQPLKIKNNMLKVFSSTFSQI